MVRAFNDDLPYDQFVQKQLAADLMPDAAPEDRAALGFLGLSPTYWKELKLDKDVIKAVVAEEWEERIHSGRSTFLGSDRGVRRCHDHKFDPISTQDYYALAGVFASIRQADLPLIAGCAPLRVVRRAGESRRFRTGSSKLKADKSPIAVGTTKQIAELESRDRGVKKATANYDSPLAPRRGAKRACTCCPTGRIGPSWIIRPGVAQDVAVQIRGNPANARPGRAAPLPDGAVAAMRQGRSRRAAAGSDWPGPSSTRERRCRPASSSIASGSTTSAPAWSTRRAISARQGARPSHPQLLDDLTARFIAERLVAQMAAPRDHAVGGVSASDRVSMPDEACRRSGQSLLVAHESPPAGSRGVARRHAGGGRHARSRSWAARRWTWAMPKNHRRTLYGTVKRRELHDMLRLFDFPDPTTHSAARMPTTTPLQQLFVAQQPVHAAAGDRAGAAAEDGRAGR